MPEPRPAAPPASKKPLPDPLPAPEVLYCTYNRWMVVALTRSPGKLQELVRASIPPREKATRKGAERPFPGHVARIYWSEARQVFWMRMVQYPRRPYLLDASRIPARLRSRVPHAEPERALSKGDVASSPEMGARKARARRAPKPARSPGRPPSRSGRPGPTAPPRP